METDSPQPCSKCCAGWRLPLLLVLVLIAVLLSQDLGIWNSNTKPEENAAEVPAAAPGREHVLLAIDFAVGRRQDFDPLPWHEGMTVADLLRSAPGIETTQTGSGQGAFLTAIDGVANQGADGNNWTYAVNDQSADRSYAVYELEPDDRVLWTFGRRQ